MSFTSAIPNTSWRVMFGLQATPKTPLTPGTDQFYALGITNEDWDLPVPEVEFIELFDGSTLHLPFENVEGKKSYRGTAKTPMYTTNLMQEAFGAMYSQPDTPSAGDTQRTFSSKSTDVNNVATRPLPWIDLIAWTSKTGVGWTTDEDIGMHIKNVKIGKVGFEFNENEIVMVDFEFVACDSSKITAAPTNQNEIPASQSAYMFKQGTVNLNGASYARVKSLSFSLSHNLEERWYNNEKPFDILEGRATFDASATIEIEDDDIWDEAVADSKTPNDVVVSLDRGGTTDTLVLTLSAALMNPKIKKGTDKAVEAELTFKILSAKLVEAQLTATAGTYPIA